MSLDVTDVITTAYEDCIEPTTVDPLVLGPGKKQYFEAKTASSTAPPTDWTVGPDCTAGDMGLVCTGSNDASMLTYTGAGTVAALSFDVVSTGSTTVQLLPDSQPVDTTVKRVTFIAVLSTDMAVRRGSLAGTTTISNFEIQPLQPPASANIVKNARAVFTLDGSLDVSGAQVVDDETYIAAFKVSTDGDYHVGSLCSKAGLNGTCQSNPSCSLYDAAGVDLGSLAWEWDASVDPLNPENPFSDPNTIQRTTAAQTLTAGAYYIKCNTAGRVFVRTYDDSLVRSCSYLTWYFSLRQGGCAPRQGANARLPCLTHIASPKAGAGARTLCLL